MYLKYSVHSGYQEMLEHGVLGWLSAERERLWEKFILNWSVPKLSLESRFT